MLHALTADPPWLTSHWSCPLAVGAPLVALASASIMRGVLIALALTGAALRASAQQQVDTGSSLYSVQDSRPEFYSASGSLNLSATYNQVPSASIAEGGKYFVNVNGPRSVSTRDAARFLTIER